MGVLSSLLACNIQSSMKSVVAALCLLAAVAAEPEADASYAVGYYGHGYHPYAYHGYHYGKRSADADADAEASYGYPYAHHYGKRSADADADAEASYGYYGYGYAP